MKIVYRILLILCLPAFLMGSISLANQEIQDCIEVPKNESGQVSPWELFRPEKLSVDQYFQFIELIENESFLNSLSQEEFDAVVDFVTRIIRLSAPESMPYLQEEYEYEIEQLMEDLYGDRPLGFSLATNFDIQIKPAIDFQNPDIRLCKGWFKRKAHHFGHWCKKHKKPLIIGAVVVGVATVAVVTAGTGTGSAVAVGGALVGNSMGDPSPHPVNKPGEVLITQEHSMPPLADHIPIIHQQSEEVKVELFEALPNEVINIPSQEQPSFWNKVKEKGREAASQFAHGAYDVITEQLEPIATIEGGAHQLIEKLSPSLNAHSPFEENPQETFHKQVTEGHQKIDEVFDTEYASLYSDEAKVAKEEITTGVLPLPGTIKTTSNKFFNDSLKHIFCDRPGHLIDTPHNRQLLLEVAGDSKNYLGTDKYGKAWHARMQKDGKQVWTCSRNGAIRNGGLNETPRGFDIDTGLSSPEKPK